MQGPRSWPTFEAGYEALRGSGLECAARVILTPETAEAFEATLDQVDAALGATPGPWFLETDGPTLVDMQCVRPAALSRGFYTLYSLLRVASR